MVNKALAPASPHLARIAVLLRVYLAVVVATVVVLAVLSVVAPDQAPAEAWGHAVVVAAFAVLLPLRLRSARAGSIKALRAVGLVAAVLFLVNVVEALVPGFVPGWMRVEMVLVAALMLLVIGCVVRERV